MSENLFSKICLAVSGILSMVSTVILILFFALSKRSRSFGFKLVLPLFIFDFIWSSSVAIPTFYSIFDEDSDLAEQLCIMQGTIKLLSMLGSFFCTACISWSLYTFIIRCKPIKTKNPIKYFSLFSILTPILLSILSLLQLTLTSQFLPFCAFVYNRPIILNRYGHLDPLKKSQCFLSLDESDGETDYLGILLRIFLYYIPFGSVLMFDIFTVIKIYIFFHQNKIDFQSQQEVKNLMLYPIVLFLSWIWIIIERISEIFSSLPSDELWLNQVDLAMATLNGFLNALVYGYISLDPFGFFRKRSITEQEEIEQPIDDQEVNLKQQFIENSTNNNNVIKETQDSHLGDEDYSVMLKINKSYDES